MIILNVNAEDTQRDGIHHILDEAGYKTLDGQSGSDVFVLLREKPDLILLNSNLPDMTGVDILHQIKADSNGAMIPIICILPSEEQNSAKDVLNLVDGCLSYPFNSPSLVGMVKALLRARQAEKTLFESESRYHQLIDQHKQTQDTLQTFMEALPESALILDANGTILAANLAYAQRLNKNRADVQGANAYNHLPLDIAMARKAHIAEVFRTGNADHFEDIRTGRYIDNIIYPIFNAKHQVIQVAILGLDITERKNSEIAQLQINDNLEKRVQDRTIELSNLNESLQQEITERNQAQNLIQTRLQLTDFAATHSLEELLVEALDEMGELTQSPIGFFHFVEPDQKNLVLQAWSTRTLKEFCTAQGRGQHYSIDQAGVWVDCVHQRRPVIHNDLASLPHRKGFPDGHASVIREIVVPVMRGDRIVAIVGVGNKPSNYGDQDVIIASYLADVVWEIIERKRTEQTLNEALDLNQKIIEASSLGIFACRVDGACVLANQAVAKISGASLEKMLTLNFRQLASWKENGLFQIAENVLETGKEQRAEIHITSSFGKDVWLNYHFTRFTRNNEPHFLMLVDDVTERKLAEKAMQQSEEQFRSLFESSREGIIYMDMDGMIQDANPTYQDMVGYSMEELKSMSSRQLTPQKWHTLEDDLARTQIFTRDYSDEYEKEYIRKNGTVFPINVRKWLIKNGEGTPVGEWAMVRDITERKQAEAALESYAEQLEKSNQDLQDFASIASHDLQEPLRMVSSYVQILATDYKGKLDPEADEYIGYAVDGAKRMQRLIEDLLTYSRVSTRGQPLQQVNSHLVLEEVLKNLALVIEESGAIITHDPMPIVMADKTQLYQLFLNLLSNALKFRGPDPSRIHVGAQHTDSQWLFTMKDNGIGIEPQYFDRIFVIFKRLHTRSEYSGTGIGLALCKKIVERHGGHIWVESELGHGTTFYFTLPTHIQVD
jgi:PAS domain S-box-containing protein